MFLFKRMNKMIHTGNNGRGPGGPRLPSDGAVTPMTGGLNNIIPAVGISSYPMGFDRPLWPTVSSVYRQTMGTSGTYHGLVNS